jgi:hypothetical protein
MPACISIRMCRAGVQNASPSRAITRNNYMADRLGSGFVKIAACPIRALNIHSGVS